MLKWGEPDLRGAEAGVSAPLNGLSMPWGWWSLARRLCRGSLELLESQAVAVGELKANSMNEHEYAWIRTSWGRKGGHVE